MLGDITNNGTAVMDDETARLRRLVDLSPAAIVETNACGLVRFANPRWYEMRGDDGVDTTSQRLQDLLTPASMQAYQDAVVALQSGVPVVVVDLSLTRKDGAPVHVSASVTMLADATGAFAGLAANFTDITERVIAERKLQASETRLRQILDNTVALVGIMRPDGTLIEANQPALATAGLTRDDVIGKKFWDCFWWNHNTATMAELEAAITRAAQGETLRYDAYIRMVNDVIIPIDFMLSPVLDENGNVELLVPSGFDISDRKRSEEQLAFVMREVNHRSKNMLAVVQSILRQMKSDDIAQFVHDFSARLRALSACQDLLVNAPNDSPNILDLIEAQLSHFAILDSSRLHLSGPALAISSESAQNLGMAIYELATNASKYGAMSREKGRISITWAVENDVFQLVWQESDGPEVTKPSGSGFGTVVLQDMLSMALNATTTIAYDPDGLRWSLDCPMSAIT